MALTKWEDPVSKYEYFTYYGTSNEPLIENIDFDQPFELDEVRVHLSVAFASTDDLIIKVSSILGSAYDVLILSYAMYGHTDVIYQPERTKRFIKGDCLSVQLSFKSGVNVYGLTLLGWGITG